MARTSFSTNWLGIFLLLATGCFARSPTNFETIAQDATPLVSLGPKVGALNDMSPLRNPGGDSVVVVSEDPTEQPTPSDTPFAKVYDPGKVGTVKLPAISLPEESLSQPLKTFHQKKNALAQENLPRLTNPLGFQPSNDSPESKLQKLPTKQVQLKPFDQNETLSNKIPNGFSSTELPHVPKPDLPAKETLPQPKLGTPSVSYKNKNVSKTKSDLAKNPSQNADPFSSHSGQMNIKIPKVHSPALKDWPTTKQNTKQDYLQIPYQKPIPFQSKPSHHPKAQSNQKFSVSPLQISGQTVRVASLPQINSPKPLVKLAPPTIPSEKGPLLPEDNFTNPELPTVPQVNSSQQLYDSSLSEVGIPKEIVKFHQDNFQRKADRNKKDSTQNTSTNPRPSASPSSTTVIQMVKSPEPRQTAEPPLRLSPKPLEAVGLRPVSHVAKGKPAGSLRKLYDLAAEANASIDSYIVRFRRREKVNGRMEPEELMLFKFRKNPWSVYFKWLGENGKNREVIYVKGQFGNKIHTLTAAGDIPFMPAGKRMALALDSPLVRSHSRHPITEAGMGIIIDRFGTIVNAVEQGDNRLGTLKYLGPVDRPEFAYPVEAVLYNISPRVEELLPRGGERFIYFDMKLRLPVLIITRDHNRQVVEYYCYDRFLFPGHLLDEEFNPDLLWKKR